MAHAIAARKAAYAGATKILIQATEEEPDPSSEHEEVVSLGKRRAKTTIHLVSNEAMKKPRYFAERLELQEDVGSEPSTRDDEELGFDAPFWACVVSKCTWILRMKNPWMKDKIKSNHLPCDA